MSTPNGPARERPTSTARSPCVTGGAGGLGRRPRVRWPPPARRVVVADLDEDAATRSPRRSTAASSRPTCPPSRTTRRWSRSPPRRCGGLDLVHLNAGVAAAAGIGDDFDLDRYRRAMGVNLDGVVFGTHAALPALRERGGGAIVATASLAGLTARPLRPDLRRQQARGRRPGALARPGARPTRHPLQRDLPGLRRVGDHRADPRGAASSRASPIIPAEAGRRRGRVAVRRRDDRRVLVRAGRPRGRRRSASAASPARGAGRARPSSGRKLRHARRNRPFDARAGRSSLHCPFVALPCTSVSASTAILTISP